MLLRRLALEQWRLHVQRKAAESLSLPCLGPGDAIDSYHVRGLLTGAGAFKPMSPLARATSAFLSAEFGP